MERMAAADVACLNRESRTAPQHVGGLAVFAPAPGGFDYDRLVRLLEERISLAPRFRQKVRQVPGQLANPVWVDDPAFDITYHVRRSGLPRPGSDAQLLEFCARIQSRLLDRSRPLWEMYLVEGLTDGRVAIVTKTHEAMVAERGGVDLMQVVLDAAPEPRRTVEALWVPDAEPSSAQLLGGALAEVVQRPVVLLDAVRLARHDLGAVGGRLSATTSGVLSVGRALLRKPAPTPLQVELGEHRRLAIARTALADYRAVRDALGGSVNDVMLAVVAGALREWLLARSVSLRPASTVRALVPVSVTDGAVPLDLAGGVEASSDVVGAEAGDAVDGEPEAPAIVRPLLVDLPVGEPDARLRLAQLRYAMAAHQASGLAVGADRLVRLRGYGPPTLHALGARAATGLTRRVFALSITNVPGAQWQLYAAGAPMAEMFPFIPLNPGQGLSIGLSSYDGGVYWGITGDRDALPDLDLLAGLVEESLAELLAAAGSVRRHSQDGASR